MGISIVPESTGVRRPPISPPPKTLSADKPTAPVFEGLPLTLPRILSPEEFEQAQNLPSHAIAQSNFPLLPPVPKVAAEATRVGNEPKNPLAQHLTGIGRILSEYGFEPIAHGLDYSPVATTASFSPPGAIVGAASMLHDMAQYAGQKAAEHQLDEATRKLAEADPDRIPGERAAVEAIMLGAGPLIHAGVKAVRGRMAAGVPMDVATRQRVFAGLDPKTQEFVKNDPHLSALFDPPPDHPSLRPPAARLETAPFDPANPKAPITPFDVAHPDIPKLRALNKSVPSTHLIDTPERHALREQVTVETLKRGAQWADQGPHQGVVQGQEAHIVVGPPAAGKSSQLAEPIAAQFGGRVIDADIAKEQLPEFDHGRMAGAVHVESADIMQEATRRAASAGDNLVLPVVGKTLSSVQTVIRALAEQGYKVHLYLADLGPDKAAGRAVARFLKENRFVDPHYVLHDVGTKPQENFQHLVTNPEPNVESYAHFNADVPRGAPYQLVDAGSVDRPGRLGAGSPSERITPGQTPRATDAGAAAPEPQAGEVAGSIAPAEPSRFRARAGSLIPKNGAGSPFRPNVPREAPGTPYTAPLDAGDNPRMLNVAKLGLSPEGEQQLRAMLPATGEKTKVTQAETAALARELELDPERLHRRIGDWSGAEALAAQNVMSQNTERIVALSKVTQDMTKPLAEREQAQGEISRLTSDVRTLAGRLAGERSKMGRDLNALKIIAKNTMDPSVWLAQAERVRGGLPLTPEHQTEILRLTGLKDRAGLVSYISGLAKTTNVDKGLALWKAGLLTGLRTHEVNVMSNVAMAGMESVKDIPAVIIDRIASMVTGERTVAPSFRGNIIEASKGIGKGFRSAIKVVKEGDPATMERWDFRKTNFDSPILQAYHDAVFRSLSAEDAIARGAAMGRALEEHLRLRAKVLADADPSKTFAQHLEALRQNPPDDVVVKATADAEYAVFQNDNALSRGVSAFKKQLPDGGRAAADVVLPFVKTPTNVAMRMADYSPIGFFTTLAKQITEPSQRHLAQGLGRAVTGSSLVWLGYTLASEGKATGTASTSPGQRDLQAMQGAGANRVRMGRKWVDVSRVSPAGALVAVGSQLYHATHTGEPQTPSETAGAAAFSLGRVVLDQPMVSGLSNALDAIKDPAHAGGRFVSRLAGSVVPTIVSDAASAMDPTQRDVSGIAASVEARVPGLRDNLPAKLDAFGHPVENRNQGADAFFNALNVSDAKDDPLVGELIRLQVSLPQPGKTVTVGKVSHERSDEDRRTLKQTIGAEAEKRLRKVLTQDAYSVLTDEEKKVVLERIIGNVRGTAYAQEKARVRRGERQASNTPSGAQ